MLGLLAICVLGLCVSAVFDDGFDEDEGASDALEDSPISTEADGDVDAVTEGDVGAETDDFSDTGASAEADQYYFDESTSTHIVNISEVELEGKDVDPIFINLNQSTDLLDLHLPDSAEGSVTLNIDWAENSLNDSWTKLNFNISYAENGSEATLIQFAPILLENISIGDDEVSFEEFLLDANDHILSIIEANVAIY